MPLRGTWISHCRKQSIWTIWCHASPQSHGGKKAVPGSLARGERKCSASGAGSARTSHCSTSEPLGLKRDLNGISIPKYPLPRQRKSLKWQAGYRLSPRGIIFHLGRWRYLSRYYTPSKQKVSAFLVDSQHNIFNLTENETTRLEIIFSKNGRPGLRNRASPKWWHCTCSIIYILYPRDIHSVNVAWFREKGLCRCDIRSRILRWKHYPGSPRWTLNTIPCIPMWGRQLEMREGSAKKEREQSAMASSQGPPTGTRSWEGHHDDSPLQPPRGRAVSTLILA